MQGFMSRLMWSACALVASSALMATRAHAEQIVSSATLKSTENGVFMSNGRYFVAGNDGIHELKRSADSSPGCQLEPGSGFTLCRLMAPQFNGDTCFYSGMTTDDTYLYAVCTVWANDSILSQVVPPKRAYFIRLKPGSGASAQITTKPFASPTWYNGMTMLDSKTILMTPSGPLGTKPAIVKLKITNTATLDHSITTWLPASPLYLLNNGLTVSGDHVYFVGGQNLFRIRVNSDGSAGLPVLIYQTTVNQVLDDLAVKGDWLAVAEIGIVNGLGLNSITFIHKTGLAPSVKLWTGLTQLSSLAVDPGSFGTPGALVATSYFQGGIYRYFY